MGGPGGGGGGYATTGSIGATAGSGGDAVDECGLRFLLAMRHHTCLMRSLPPKHRAVLEERVKFIVYLTVQLAYGTCFFSGRNASSPSGRSFPKSKKNIDRYKCSHPTLFANIPVSYERIHLASLFCADVYLSSSDSQHSCFIFVGTHLSHADSNLSPHT